ncbi:hypothetical protein YC2023_059448 [Brassica napus]
MILTYVVFLPVLLKTVYPITHLSLGNRKIPPIMSLLHYKRRCHWGIPEPPSIRWGSPYLTLH